ncbi:hypothetical protein [Paenibacillus campinasensis]|uniref:Uncharacterized protein n=1 Tax=Paenibacillus campinasensis TaxID=66347 RepID=A0A268EIV3_9BACL|nr:hypothetical protein [Paenibacillus campinasensis]PAD73067.1 hypothetical protein CHH67_21040 [Paenibacillus campinasensis]
MFQSKREKNIIVITFILNAVAFGFVNVFSAFGWNPMLAENYPFLIILVWSMILASFLQNGWKAMFYINAVPFIGFLTIPLVISGYSEPDSDVFVSPGGAFVFPRDLIIIGIFLVCSIIVQLILRQFNMTKNGDEEQ